MRRSIFMLWSLGAVLVTDVASALTAGPGTVDGRLVLSSVMPAIPAPFGALLWAGLGLGGIALFARRGDPHAEAG